MKGRLREEMGRGGPVEVHRMGGLETVCNKSVEADV